MRARFLRPGYEGVVTEPRAIVGLLFTRVGFDALWTDGSGIIIREPGENIADFSTTLLPPSWRLTPVLAGVIENYPEFYAAIGYPELARDLKGHLKALQVGDSDAHERCWAAFMETQLIELYEAVKDRLSSDFNDEILSSIYSEEWVSSLDLIHAGLLSAPGVASVSDTLWRLVVSLTGQLDTSLDDYFDLAPSRM